MHYKFRNVNDAFQDLVAEFSNPNNPSVARRTSRYGDTLTIEEPVTITYNKPLERVLFNTARDCNPFFHLYESLWMLAGRNDVAPLAYYNSIIHEFSDDGETFNGAYGYRWRKAWTSRQIGSADRIDQLQVIVDHLKYKPDSRRAVLQMWNVEDDLMKVGIQDTTGPDNKERRTYAPPSKDVCCNLSVCFYLRETDGTEHLDFGDTHTLKCKYLDMTVFNRSNDLIWGALGANVVHLSFLQEYLAGQLGVGVGVYNQISNNLHVYTKNWKPDEWLAPYGNPKTQTMWSPPVERDWYAVRSGGDPRPLRLIPLISDPKTFDKELPEFVQRHSVDAMGQPYSEPFLREVAQPMCIAFHLYKRRDFSSAIAVARTIVADDWMIASVGWLERRAEKVRKEGSK